MILRKTKLNLFTIYKMTKFWFIINYKNPFPLQKAKQQLRPIEILPWENIQSRTINTS